MSPMLGNYNPSSVDRSSASWSLFVTRCSENACIYQCKAVCTIFHACREAPSRSGGVILCPKNWRRKEKRGREKRSGRKNYGTGVGLGSRDVGLCP